MRFVVDACVWIDLGIGDLLAEVFRLPHEFVSPDVVLEELASVDPRLLRALGVREVSLASEDYVLLEELVARYAGPSIRDLTALVVALRDGLALLSGDRKLREAAEAEGVEVSGVLWLLDELVDTELVTGPNAARGLQAMLDQHARLPRDECERRLRKWVRLRSS